MHTKFLRHIEQCAKSAGFSPMLNCATFNLSVNHDAKGILPGAVYGVAIILDEEDAIALESEARARGSLKTPLSKLKRLPLGDASAIPLYWGKDAAVGFRLYRHLLDKKPKTGNLGGRFYSTLASKDLLAASVPVCDFKRFEKHMERTYPPLLFNVKTNNIGRYSIISV